MKTEDVTAFLIWLPFAVTATALVGLGLWFFRPGVRRWALPPQRHRAVPWSGTQIIILFALVDVLLPALVLELLRSLHVFSLVYGPDNEITKELFSTRAGIWTSILVVPCAVVSVPALLAWRSGTLPYQIGLHTHRLGRNVLVGCLAWLAFMPFLILLWVTLGWLLTRLGQPSVEEHPLTKLGHESGFWIDRILLVITAMLAAPVIEELLFRGVLQPWLWARRLPAPADTPRIPDLFGLQAFFRLRSSRQSTVIALAVFWSLVVRSSQVVTGWRTGDLGLLLRELAPGLFTLSLAGLFFTWRSWRGWPPEEKAADPVGAVFASALFFAAAHSGVWPSPVPLFLLGLVLGFLAYRTQSLVPSIVLHSLFNGVACVLLFFPQIAEPFTQPPKGNAETAALMRPVVVSTSTPVPGSQEPRRR